MYQGRPGMQMNRPMGQPGLPVGQRMPNPSMPPCPPIPERPPPPKLVHIFPPQIYFIPPYGVKPHKFMCNVTNVTGKIICYKVEVVLGLEQFYDVIPDKGVIHPYKTTVVTFHMKDKINPFEMKNIERHIFHLTALCWPSTQLGFDEEIWAQMIGILQADLQVVELEALVDLDLHMKIINALPQALPQPVPQQSKGANAQQTQPPETMPMQSKGPDLVDIDPTELHYNRPYGKKRQNIGMKIQVLGDDQVAFKIKSQKQSVDFFSVEPAFGLINGNEEKVVNFDMLGGKDEVKVMNSAEEHKPHKFHMCFMPWIGSKYFDNEVWKRKENANSNIVQIVVIEAPLESLPDEEETPEPKEKEKQSKPGKATKPKESIVNINPTKLTFPTPNGSSHILSITITAKKARIGYKIMGNKHDLYSVMPSKGIISVGESEEIKFEMRDVVTKDDIVGGGHKFVIIAALWPTSSSAVEFDADVWKKINKIDMIISNIPVNHK